MSRARHNKELFIPVKFQDNEKGEAQLRHFYNLSETVQKKQSWVVSVSKILAVETTYVKRLIRKSK